MAFIFNDLQRREKNSRSAYRKPTNFWLDFSASIVDALARSKTSEVEPATYTPPAKQIGARKGMKVWGPVKWKNHPDYKWRVDWV